MKIPVLAIQQGAAAGMIIVVIKLVAYLYGVEALMSGWVGFGQLVLVVAGMFLACSMERNAGDGFLTFGRSFFVALSAATVATLFGVVIDIVLSSILDPELNAKMIEQIMAEFEDSGFTQLIPKSELDKMPADLEYWMNPFGKLIGWVFGILFWAIGALIVGAIMQRSNPKFF